MEKNRKSSTVIIVVLLLLILGLGGYLVYDKIIIESNNDKEEIKEENKKTEEKNEEITLEVTDETVQNLYNGITDTSRVISSYMCGIEKVYYKTTKVTANDVPNDLAYILAITKLAKDLTDVELSQTTPTFTSEQISNEIKNVFGENYLFEHKTYQSCPVWNYNATTNNYEFMGSGCGGACGPTDQSEIVKAIKNNETIEIYTRVLFASETNGEYKYFKDAGKTKVIDLNKDINGYLIIEDKDLAQGSLYKLTFKEETGNYIFISSELVSE